MVEPPTAILLYDASCGFCSEVVQFILARDRERSLRFAPLTGPTAAAVLARHPGLADVDSVLWVEPTGVVLARSDATLRLARYLGGVWGLVATARLIPRRWRDALYDVVAKHRHRLRRDAPVCVIPTAEERSRFLDQ